MKKDYKHIFEPFTVRRMTVKNRIHDDAYGDKLRRTKRRNEFPPY